MADPTRCRHCGRAIWQVKKQTWEDEDAFTVCGYRFHEPEPAPPSVPDDALERQACVLQQRVISMGREAGVDVLYDALRDARVTQQRAEQALRIAEQRAAEAEEELRSLREAHESACAAHNDALALFPGRTGSLVKRVAEALEEEHAARREAEAQVAALREALGSAYEKIVSRGWQPADAGLISDALADATALAAKHDEQVRQDVLRGLASALRKVLGDEETERLIGRLAPERPLLRMLSRTGKEEPHSPPRAAQGVALAAEYARGCAETLEVVAANPRCDKALARELLDAADVYRKQMRNAEEAHRRA